MYKTESVDELFSVTSFHSAIPFQWDESFIFDGEDHDFWEIVFVTEGEVEVTEDEKVYRLQKNDLILHAPMEFHRIRSYGGTLPHVLVLSFKHQGLMPSSLSEGLFSLSKDEVDEYHALFLRAHHWFRDQGDETSASKGAEIGTSLASFLLRTCARHIPGSTVSNQSRAREYQYVIEAMQREVCSNLTLPEIAARAAISVSKMKSLFLTYSGVSPKKYYAQLQIREAMRYLESGMSVSEVSDRLSFSSPNYFSLFYKRHLGYPPHKSKK